MSVSDGKTPANRLNFCINLHNRLPLWVVLYVLQREVGACNWALKYAFLSLKNCSFFKFLTVLLVHSSIHSINRFGLRSHDYREL